MRHSREVSSAGRPGDDTNSARSRRRPERPASRDERAARARARGSDAARARDLAALSSRPAPCAARPGLRSSSLTSCLRVRRGSRRRHLPRAFRQSDKVGLEPGFTNRPDRVTKIAKPRGSRRNYLLFLCEDAANRRVRARASPNSWRRPKYTDSHRAETHSRSRSASGAPVS